MISEYGQVRGDEIALRTFIKDLETQAWELSGLPTPNRYQIHLIPVDGQIRFVHESNLEDKSDLMALITDKIRRGLEKKQAEIYKQAIINANVGDTIFWVSPKRTASETKEECPYPDSHFVVARIVEQEGQKVAVMSQYQLNAEAAQMGQAINVVVGKEVVKKGASIDEILLSVTSLQKDISDQAIWEALEKATGQKILKESPEVYQQLHQKITRSALIGGRQLLDLIKSGVSGEELKKRHVEILLSVLGDIKSDKVRYNSDGSVDIETSCGDIGSRGVNQGVKKENPNGVKMYCTDTMRCGEENTCNMDYCYKCGSRLSRTKPS